MAVVQCVDGTVLLTASASKRLLAQLEKAERKRQKAAAKRKAAPAKQSKPQATVGKQRHDKTPQRPDDGGTPPALGQKRRANTSDAPPAKRHHSDNLDGHDDQEGLVDPGSSSSTQKFVRYFKCRYSNQVKTMVSGEFTATGYQRLEAPPTVVDENTWYRKDGQWRPFPAGYRPTVSDTEVGALELLQLQVGL